MRPWVCQQVFVNTYLCLCLQQLTSSANPLTPQSLLFLEHSRHYPALGSLLLLSPLPETLFPQISFWLSPSHPSGLHFCLTSSLRPTLISIFNTATAPPYPPFLNPPHSALHFLVLKALITFSHTIDLFIYYAYCFISLLKCKLYEWKVFICFTDVSQMSGTQYTPNKESFTE